SCQGAEPSPEWYPPPCPPPQGGDGPSRFAARGSSVPLAPRLRGERDGVRGSLAPAPALCAPHPRPLSPLRGARGERRSPARDQAKVMVRQRPKTGAREE